MAKTFLRVIQTLYPYQIKKGPEARIVNQFGQWTAVYFEDNRWGSHIALVKGEVSSLRGEKAVFLRIDSGCYTGAVLGDLQCDCVQQLHQAMRIIRRVKLGLVVFIPGHEARGYGLLAKLKSFGIQNKDRVGTVTAFKKLGLNPPDIRSYEGVAIIIKRLGINSVNLLSNNPNKVNQLRKYGIKVDKMIPVLIKPTKFTRIHLKEKEEKLGHRGLITKFH